jgi:hypothetical protein
MIGAPEQAALPGRLNPIYLEGRPLQLEPVVARQLGLRDGQTVQANVELRGDSLKMLLNGRLFDLPPGLRMQHAGDVLLLRVQAQAGNLLLKPVDAQTLPAAPAGAAAAAFLNTSRLQALSLRPPMASSLMFLLQPGVIGSLMQAAGSPELTALLQRMRLTMGSLNPGALQGSVQNSGLWLEAMLSQGQGVAGHDQKSWLRRMIRASWEPCVLSSAICSEAIFYCAMTKKMTSVVLTLLFWCVRFGGFWHWLEPEKRNVHACCLRKYWPVVTILGCSLKMCRSTEVNYGGTSLRPTAWWV